jgi:hypothetical protein
MTSTYRVIPTVSNRLGLPGDQVEVAPVAEGPLIRGEVVYCEKFDKTRFFVGFKFHRGRTPGRILQR